MRRETKEDREETEIVRAEEMETDRIVVTTRDPIDSREKKPLRQPTRGSEPRRQSLKQKNPRLMQ